MDLEALDSHTFDWVGDPNAYYHVNFKAKLGTRDSPLSLFFAELQGIDGPERANICVELSSSGNPQLYNTVWFVYSDEMVTSKLSFGQLDYNASQTLDAFSRAYVSKLQFCSGY